MTDALETAQRAGAGGDTPVVAARRRCIATDKERLAAAYIALGLVPETMRSTSNAKQITRCVEADHNRLSRVGGDARPQNLLPPTVHLEKSRRDKAIATKWKRISAKIAEFRHKLLAKAVGLQTRTPRVTRKGNAPPTRYSIEETARMNGRPTVKRSCRYD